MIDELKKNEAGAKLIAGFEKAWPGMNDKLTRLTQDKGFSGRARVEVADELATYRIMIAEQAATAKLEGTVDRRFSDLNTSLCVAACAIVQLMVQNNMKGMYDSIEKIAAEKHIREEDFGAAVRSTTLMTGMNHVMKWEGALLELLTGHMKMCIREHLDLVIGEIEEKMRRDNGGH